MRTPLDRLVWDCHRAMPHERPAKRAALAEAMADPAFRAAAKAEHAALAALIKARGRNACAVSTARHAVLTHTLEGADAV